MSTFDLTRPPDTPPRVVAPKLAAAAVRRLARRRSRSARLEIVEGTRVLRGGGEGPEVRVTVHDPRAYGALLRGSVGLAQSYVAGWWDADDLTELIRLLARDVGGLQRRLDGLGRMVTGPLSVARRLAPPSAETDRRNVQAHYDLPGRLFEVMLDETMTYSCALFAEPGATLAEAQRAKMDRICAKLSLGPDDHVVEIGGGWGGFAIHAASRYGCRVTTTTISGRQLEVATARVAAAGLAERVRVLGADYRDVTGTFDKLVSIEMIEAVDWRRHDELFATCRRLLRPGGLMALQAIVIADASFERAKHHDDFIRSMVFPGSTLPSVTALSRAAGRAGLALVDLEDIGRHYAETLARWRRNVDQHWGDLAGTGLQEGFHRLWDFYLSYCEAAFLERHISDVQMVLAGPAWHPGLSLRML